MPFTVPQPMLARLADKLPVSPHWSYEIKWDGDRCLAEKRGSRVILHSRPRDTRDQLPERGCGGLYQSGTRRWRWISAGVTPRTLAASRTERCAVRATAVASRVARGRPRRSLWRERARPALTRSTILSRSKAAIAASTAI